jgi:RNA polymerase-interacting CarD/CdnL/TRCF family regulator
MVSDTQRVEDLQTVAECDDAVAQLDQTIRTIQEQLRDPRPDRAPGWDRHARAAMQLKKAARQAVQVRRGELARAARQQQQATQERRLLDILKANFPHEFAQALDMYRSQQ